MPSSKKLKLLRAVLGSLKPGKAAAERKMAASLKRGVQAENMAASLRKGVQREIKTPFERAEKPYTYMLSAIKRGGAT